MAIFLLKHGEKVLLDDLDYIKIKDFTWILYKTKDKNPMAVYSSLRIGKNKKRVALQNIILNPKKGFVVDHIDGNPLNNKRSNLRVCTQANNLLNKKLYKNNKSGHKGIYFNKKRNTYRVLLYYKRVRHVKEEKNLCEAIELRKKWEIKYFGKYAR